MKATFHYGLTALVALALTWAGCSSGAQEPASATELKRQTLDPKVGAFLVDGQRAYERGVYTLALAMTDSAERYAPDLADLHYLRGLVYTQLNRGDVAQAAYETVLELDPRYKGARHNLGLLAFRQGKLRDAIDWFLKEDALETNTNVQLELGRAYARLGEPDSARAAYEAAVALDSTNATALMWLGQLHEELGELDEALAVSRRGLRLKPESRDYQYIIGSLLNRMGQAEEAVPYLRPIADERPWHHGAQYNLGQALMRLGHEDEAQTYFVRADSAQQVQQRISDAENAIGRDPQALEPWLHLGDLLRTSGQLDRAVEAYEVAVSLDPWNLYLQNNLALLMMESGDADGAIRRYRAILGMDSTLVDVWLNLGVAYANAGQRGPAEEAWTTALRHRPGYPPARALLARLSEIQ